MADAINRTQRNDDGKLKRIYSQNTPSINTNVWLVNPDLSGVGGVAERYWKVTGTPPAGVVEEMNQSEKDAIDATILAYAKTVKKAALRTNATELLNQRYDPQDREWFQTLYTEAVGSGKTNRRAYLDSWFAWMEDVVIDVKDKFVDVNNATTVAAVQAVALDTATLAASDPDITIAGTLAITN